MQQVVVVDPTSLSTLRVRSTPNVEAGSTLGRSWAQCVALDQSDRYWAPLAGGRELLFRFGGALLPRVGRKR